MGATSPHTSDINSSSNVMYKMALLSLLTSDPPTDTGCQAQKGNSKKRVKTGNILGLPRLQLSCQEPSMLTSAPTSSARESPNSEGVFNLEDVIQGMDDEAVDEVDLSVLELCTGVDELDYYKKKNCSFMRKSVVT